MNFSPEVSPIYALLVEKRQSRLQKPPVPPQKGTMAQPSLSDVAGDPDWLPHTYDQAGAALTFVHVPADRRGGLMFLSDEHFAGNFDKIAFPAESVAEAVADSARAPLHFIFHTSFCCSTLLARALDIPGTSSALKEPDVLINVANRLIRSDDPANRKRLELVLRLLERPQQGTRSVIVKPTNFANRTAEPALSARPDSRAVLLYSDVGTFLRSLLKRGMWGRILGRKLFAQLSGWSSLKIGIAPADTFVLTDVQVAALAWLMQIAHFDRLARAFGPDRVMVIDSPTLLADPSAAIGKAQALFGLGLSGEQIEEIATGPVFSRHSKFTDRDYSAQARASDHEAVNSANREELDMVTKWIEAVAQQAGAPLRPGG